MKISTNNMKMSMCCFILTFDSDELAPINNGFTPYPFIELMFQNGLANIKAVLDEV